jgi:hypothetical protein
MSLLLDQNKIYNYESYLESENHTHSEVIFQIMSPLLASLMNKDFI